MSIERIRLCLSAGKQTEEPEKPSVINLVNVLSLFEALRGSITGTQFSLGSNQTQIWINNNHWSALMLLRWCLVFAKCNSFSRLMLLCCCMCHVQHLIKTPIEVALSVIATLRTLLSSSSQITFKSFETFWHVFCHVSFGPPPETLS